MVTANQHHQARLAIHTEQEARDAGYTLATTFIADECTMTVLINPTDDTDGDLLGWDMDDDMGMIVVHGHMFDEVDDA